MLLFRRPLVERTTVRLPAIRTDARPCAACVRARFRWTPVQPQRSVTVNRELHLQIRGRPEERAIQAFAANGADQAFDERMRERHVRHRLDFFHVEDAQIRLPLVGSIQLIEALNARPNRGPKQSLATKDSSSESMRSQATLKGLCRTRILTWWCHTVSGRFD
jgi:hypothetical protein